MFVHLLYKTTDNVAILPTKCQLRSVNKGQLLNIQCDASDANFKLRLCKVCFVQTDLFEDKRINTIFFYEFPARK